AELPAVRVNGDTLPPPRVWSERNPEADLRLKAARAALNEVSDEQQIPLENLLTPDYLRRVAWHPPAPMDAETIGEALTELGARPWQVDATAQKISDAFVEAHQTLLESSEAPS
ncbi:MAG: ribonuclease D, partial [Microterricola sp.]